MLKFVEVSPEGIGGMTMALWTTRGEVCLLADGMARCWVPEDDDLAAWGLHPLDFTCQHLAVDARQASTKGATSILPTC